MHVVATSGHVDHGKSTLVRALTGRDPDRLEEERRRGLSIELGYCWTDLDGVGEVAFVDVPGHQRFLTTTLAGVGPVPVAMLVVAADDPWMPQAAEHLAALDAFDVRHGVLVVTRSDLADPRPALTRARHEVARTTLAGMPEVVVSGRTGAGIDRLRETLAGQLRDLDAPDPAADVRFWVDRVFHVRGAGTVATGTLPAGTISVGDELQVGEELVRVRGLESLGRPRVQVSGVARVALDLGGHAPATLRRGAPLVTPGAFRATALVDVRLSGDGEPPRCPVLHVGSAHLGARVRPLGAGVVRLSLDASLPLWVGDRAVLRDPGRSAIWGVEVLDPRPPRLSRRGEAAARAAALATYDGSAGATLRLRGPVEAGTLRELGVAQEPLPEGVVRVGTWLFEADRVRQLREELAALVEERSTPLRPGLPLREAARALALPDPGIVSVLVAPPLVLDRGRVVAPGEGLAPELEAPLAALRSHLAEQPFAAPAADTLRELGLDRPRVAALHRSGLVLRLAEGVVLLPDAADRAVARLAQLDQPFSASQARRELGTSRRVVLPLLGHLDATGRTLRLPDDTRRLR